MFRAQPGQQSGQSGLVLLTQGREFQSEPKPGFCMPHDGVSPDFSLLHKKMEPGLNTLSPRLGRLNEQTAYAHIADARDIFASVASPVDPNVCWNFDARGQSSGRGTCKQQNRLSHGCGLRSSAFKAARRSYITVVSKDAKSFQRGSTRRVRIPRHVTRLRACSSKAAADLAMNCPWNQGFFFHCKQRKRRVCQVFATRYTLPPFGGGIFWRPSCVFA